MQMLFDIFNHFRAERIAKCLKIRFVGQQRDVNKKVAFFWFSNAYDSGFGVRPDELSTKGVRACLRLSNEKFDRDREKGIDRILK